MSELEDRMLGLIRVAGLPEPKRQYPFPMPPKAPGRPRRTAHFDFCWPGKSVVLEMEGGAFTGGGHTTGAGFTANCEKYSRAAIAGWTVVRATAPMVRDGTALALLVEALEAAER